MLLLLGNKENLRLRCSKLEFAFWLILFTIVIINTNSFRYSKPLFFLSYIFIINTLVSTRKIEIKSSHIYLHCAVFIFISVIMLLQTSNYTWDSRYFGFLVSPTIYSVYLDIAFILIYYLVRKKSLRFSLFFVFLALSIFTKTRINLLVFFTLPIILHLIEHEILSKKKIVVVFICVLVFVYPLYQFLLEFELPKQFLLGRYTDERDASFGFRYYLYLSSIDFLNQSSLTEFLFGHGSEAARLYILDLTDEDAFCHNDFLRLTIDFGIVFVSLFVFAIFKLCIKSSLSVLVGLVYLSSFYHNMVYDFYVISFLVLVCSDNVEFVANSEKSGLKKILRI